jgi:predicted metal-binding membrane protein
MTLDLRRRPEYVVIALAVAAWLWMLAQAVEAQRLSCCPACSSAFEEFVGWIGMIVAMMLPNTLNAVREVAARSYRWRRLRAVLGYVVGYLAPWALFGILLLGLRELRLGQDLRVAVALCLFAAGWVALPARERWYRLCHRTIALYPVGWGADRDTIRQGLLHGVPCVASCWPLMVACAITGHHLLLMVGGTILGAFEKRMYRFERRPLIVGSLLLAVTTLGALT